MKLTYLNGDFTLYCSQCGKEVDDNDNFCRYCGTNLKNLTGKNNQASINKNPPYFIDDIYFQQAGPVVEKGGGFWGTDKYSGFEVTFALIDEKNRWTNVSGTLSIAVIKISGASCEDYKNNVTKAKEKAELFLENIKYSSNFKKNIKLSYAQIDPILKLHESYCVHLWFKTINDHIVYGSKWKYGFH